MYHFRILYARQETTLDSKDITRQKQIYFTIILVLGGNLGDCLPQFGRLDANAGTLLINKDNKLWEEMPAVQTSIIVKGVTRDIKWVAQKNNDALLFLRNNDYPILYKIKTKKAQ